MGKKSRVLIGILGVLVLGVGIWFLVRPEGLGNMNGRYSEVTTNTSTITFSGESGDRVRFLFESEIEEGDLRVVLYDSEGSEVFDLGKARKLKTFLALDKSDTYTLAAECVDFVGRYKVEVYKVD